MTRLTLLGYTMDEEETTGDGWFLELLRCNSSRSDAAGRLLRSMIVVFTIAVSPNLEQHREDTASRANAAADICYRQCHTSSPPF